MYHQTPNSLTHLIFITTSSTAPTIYESEIIRLLSEDASVVHGPHQLSGQADLHIFISTPHSIEFDKTTPTIILNDDKPKELPSSCVILPARTAPSSVAQVGRFFLAGRGNSIKEERHAAALENQTDWVWSAVAQTTITFEKLTEPVAWLRQAAEVLEREIEGLTAEVVVAKEGDNYHVLVGEGESVAWETAKTADINAARADALLLQVNRKTFAAHLHERRRDFLIPFPSHDDLAGWILVAFKSPTEAVLQRGLLAVVITYLQSTIKQRRVIAESFAWRHAIEAGLDSVEPAIVILDKNNLPLLANRSYREIADRPFSQVGSRSKQLDQALCSARKGAVVTVDVGEVTFQVAPWGSLQNGCVLHALTDRPVVVRQSVKLKVWYDRFVAKAKTLGLKINETDVLPENAMLIDATDPEAVATELARSGFKHEIVVGRSENHNGILLSFDQEVARGEETQECPTPAGIIKEIGSFGRRLSIRFH